MMNLAEYTTSIYDLTLTTQSIDFTSSLLYGTESSYSFTSTVSESGTTFQSSSDDYRNIGGTISTKSHKEHKTFTEYTSSAYDKKETVRTYYGTYSETANEGTYLSTYTSSSMFYMVYSKQNQIDITMPVGSTAKMDVYGYATGSTFRETWQGKSISYYSEVNLQTFLETSSYWFTVSKTQYWDETIFSETIYSNYGTNISKVTTTTYIYTESYATLNVGSKYYNYSSTSSSRTINSKADVDYMDSTFTRSSIEQITRNRTIPAKSITFRDYSTTTTQIEYSLYPYTSSSTTTEDYTDSTMWGSSLTYLSSTDWWMSLPITSYTTLNSTTRSWGIQSGPEISVNHMNGKFLYDFTLTVTGSGIYNSNMSTTSCWVAGIMDGEITTKIDYLSINWDK